MRAQEFLARKKVEVASRHDARKAPIDGDGALGLLKDVDEVYAMRGKQVTHVDLRRDRPGRAALRALLLGPTGNLRAPALRRGRTLLIGFDDATYREVLG